MKTSDPANRPPTHDLFIARFDKRSLPILARGVFYTLLDISCDYPDPPVRVPNLPGYLMERGNITADEFAEAWAALRKHWAVDGPWLVALKIKRL